MSAATMSTSDPSPGMTAGVSEADFAQAMAKEIEKLANQSLEERQCQRRPRTTRRGLSFLHASSLRAREHRARVPGSVQHVRGHRRPSGGPPADPGGTLLAGILTQPVIEADPLFREERRAIRATSGQSSLA